MSNEEIDYLAVLAAEREERQRESQLKRADTLFFRFDKRFYVISQI